MNKLAQIFVVGGVSALVVHFVFKAADKANVLPDALKKEKLTDKK